ncbi:hypothetical protein ABK040_004137 [Willaertia magna]
MDSSDINNTSSIHSKIIKGLWTLSSVGHLFLGCGHLFKVFTAKEIQSERVKNVLNEMQNTIVPVFGDTSCNLNGFFQGFSIAMGGLSIVVGLNHLINFPSDDYLRKYKRRNILTSFINLLSSGLLFGLSCKYFHFRAKQIMGAVTLVNVVVLGLIGFKASQTEDEEISL